MDSAVSPENAPSTADQPAAAGPAGGDPAQGRRWLILLVGLVALTAGCTFQYGLAYLIPVLRQQGLSLELASTLVACPTIGLLLTLIAWGAAADRFGERVVLATGLGLAGAVLLIAVSVHGAAGLGLCLAVGGAASGSVFAASGRLILGWFARHERGLAMGIRQSAQPLGVALAAATLPMLGGHGTGGPLVFLGAFCLVAAALVVVLVRDPARPAAVGPAPVAGPAPAAGPAAVAGLAAAAGGPARDLDAVEAAGTVNARHGCGFTVAPATVNPHRRRLRRADERREQDANAQSGGTGSPYRKPVLWRIHAASALLVVPQFTVATFALVFLVDARGWTALAAGRLLAAAQMGGAASRLGAGYWSDRVGSRMRPMRILAVSTAIGIAALAAAAAAGSSAAVPILLACSVVAVSTNGLAFTAVAEYAGSAWAGRALGIQNTGQNALAAATPPVLALLIGSIGFGGSFAAVIAFPVVAAALVPVTAERALGGATGTLVSWRARRLLTVGRRG
jgi:sugar phosphate permease